MVLNRLSFLIIIMTSYVNAQADTSNTGSLNSGFLKHYICQMYYKDA
jgi:hypothetical protein